MPLQRDYFRKCRTFTDVLLRLYDATFDNQYLVRVITLAREGWLCLLEPEDTGHILLVSNNAQMITRVLPLIKAERYDEALLHTDPNVVITAAYPDLDKIIASWGTSAIVGLAAAVAGSPTSIAPSAAVDSAPTAIAAAVSPPTATAAVVSPPIATSAAVNPVPAATAAAGSPVPTATAAVPVATAAISPTFAYPSPVKDENLEEALAESLIEFEREKILRFHQESLARAAAPAEEESLLDWDLCGYQNEDAGADNDNDDEAYEDDEE